MDRAAKTKRLSRQASPERAFAGIILMLAAAAVVSCSAGCSAVKIAAQSAEPVEATFADPEKVILRTVEMVTVKAEYWDTKEARMKVKKWLVTPPAWIINDAAMQLRMRMKKQAELEAKAEGISSATVQEFVNPKGDSK